MSIKSRFATYTNRDSIKLLFLLRPGQEYIIDLVPEYDIYIGITGTKESIQAIDPMGGPYISIGGDLEQFFDDKITRKINKIVISDARNISFWIQEKDINNEPGQ